MFDSVSHLIVFDLLKGTDMYVFSSSCRCIIRGPSVQFDSFRDFRSIESLFRMLTVNHHHYKFDVYDIGCFKNGFITVETS